MKSLILSFILFSALISAGASAESLIFKSEQTKNIFSPTWTSEQTLRLFSEHSPGFFPYAGMQYNYYFLRPSYRLFLPHMGLCWSLSNSVSLFSEIQRMVYRGLEIPDRWRWKSGPVVEWAKHYDSYFFEFFSESYYWLETRSYFSTTDYFRVAYRKFWLRKGALYLFDPIVGELRAFGTSNPLYFGNSNLLLGAGPRLGLSIEESLSFSLSAFYGRQWVNTLAARYNFWYELSVRGSF